MAVDTRKQDSTDTDTDIPETFGGVPIKPIAESATSMGTFMAIYGPGGVGKTAIVGEVARSHGPLLYIDAEGGGKSIKHIPNVHLAEVTSWKQVRDVATDLSSKAGKHPFKTVCFDNMSEIQSMCISSIAGNSPVQIQHWGECTARLLKLTRDLREVSRTQGVNVFLIAWESLELSEGGIVTKRGVGFTPSLARQFPGIVTYVGYLQPINNFPNVRLLSFTVSTKTDAKFRVSSSEAASKIPLELYERSGSNVLGDIIETESKGIPFPVARYAKPTDNERSR